MGTLEIRIRSVKDDDIPFLKSGWKKSWHEANAHNKRFPMHVWNHDMEGRIDSALKRATVLVACDPEDEDYLFGFAAVGEDGSCLYVYVKLRFRQAGVARRLVEGLPKPIRAAAWTHWIEKIDETHPGQIVYRPSIWETAA